MKQLIKQYKIVHKGTNNPAFSNVWKVYPSAWIEYEHRWGRNVPLNWRELYDVVCYTYSIDSQEVVTR